MCLCTPNIRTPFCGKEGCKWPEKTTPPELPEEPGYVHVPGHGYIKQPCACASWPRPVFIGIDMARGE